jgi:hypothetical protein
MRQVVVRCLSLAVSVLLALSCCGTDKGSRGAQVAIEDTEQAPVFSAADEKYKDVYRGLDGRWRGTFKIYVRGAGQAEGPRPVELSVGAWSKPPYELQQTIGVEQVYTSDSSFFQRVEITDTYADGKVARSSGVNKVQDGRMYCVVKKSDDLVIHEGSTDGPETIIWARDRKSPKAIEHFRETVEATTYTIVGWGYYGDDDPTKTPGYYFEAVYERVD